MTFEGIGLAADSDDRVVWRFAQTNAMLLLTANRNAKGEDSQGKRKKKCAKVWYVTVKIVDSESPISIVLLSVLDLLRISSFLLILALTL